MKDLNSHSPGTNSTIGTISSILELEKEPLFSALMSYERVEFKLWGPVPFNLFLVKFISINLNWQFIVVTGLMALLIDLVKWNKANRTKIRRYPRVQKYRDFLTLASFVAIVPDTVFLGIFRAILGQMAMAWSFKLVGNFSWSWKRW